MEVEGVRIMATRWRLSPSQMVYVGDNTDKDFQAPRQLGMQQVWFRNTEGLYCLESNIGQFSQRSGDEMPIEGQNNIIEIIHRLVVNSRPQ